MTVEMSVRVTFALSIFAIHLSAFLLILIINPSVEIGKQDKLKLYWLAL
jgi:hypothetical protein